VRPRIIRSSADDVNRVDGNPRHGGGGGGPGGGGGGGDKTIGVGGVDGGGGASTASVRRDFVDVATRCRVPRRATAAAIAFVVRGVPRARYDSNDVSIVSATCACVTMPTMAMTMATAKTRSARDGARTTKRAYVRIGCHARASAGDNVGSDDRCIGAHVTDAVRWRRRRARWWRAHACDDWPRRDGR